MMIALGLLLVFSVACASSMKTVTSLQPVATVAVAGADGAEFDMEDEAGAEGVEFDSGAFDILATEQSDQVRVAAPGSDKVVLKITSVTVGEALAFLSGGRMPGVDAISETMIVEDGDVLDLSHLMENGAGLLTVDAEALNDDDHVVGALRKLLQLTPLVLSAEMKGNAVHVSLADHHQEPVANAQVELLDADSRSLDQTVTNGQGRAALNAGKKRPHAVLGDGLFVTARVGQFRALLSL